MSNHIFIQYLTLFIFQADPSLTNRNLPEVRYLQLLYVVTHCFVADILLLIFIFSCCWYLLSHKFVNQKCSCSFIAVVTFGMRLYFCPCLFTNIHYTHWKKDIYGITCVKREPRDMKFKTCISESLNSPEENPSPLTHDQSTDTIVNTEVLK